MLVLLVSLALAVIVEAQTGLTAQLFQLAGSSGVNNAKLAWNTVNASTSSFQVQRQTGGSGSWSTISTVAGNTYDDYGLTVGTLYSYRIQSSKGLTNQIGVTPFTPSGGWNTYDNTQPSTFSSKSQIFRSGVYYRYNYVTTTNSQFYIQQQTSQDGFTFSGNTSVLSSQTICASVSGGSCKLERVTFLQQPQSGNVVMWAHLENSQNYNLAQVACAYGVPGQGNLNFAGTYRPLGHDSRDLTFWADDAASGYAAYLISATDTNTNINIYRLTANWTAVDSLAAQVLKSQYREAPAMAKINSTYYLFTSRASGWYPSIPNYITSRNVSSGWSQPLIPGDAATFATQSGSVTSTGNLNAMLGDRWKANWSPSNPPNVQVMLPLSYAQQNSAGYANFHYFPTVKYTSTAQSGSTPQTYGVQRGKVLSIGKTLTSTPSGGTNSNLANDGVNNDNSAFFLPPSVPFTLQVDLGTASNVTQVDWATTMVQGSETYYQYTISGSTDNSKFTQIGSQTGNTQVGFVSTLINSQTKFRYVNVSVSKVINTNNGNEADFARGVLEFTVYGY